MIDGVKEKSVEVYHNIGCGEWFNLNEKDVGDVKNVLS